LKWNHWHKKIARAKKKIATTKKMSKKSLNCRFYEKKYPDNDELVVVRVKSISEIGCYVSLLEYDNIEGLILSGELSRKRIRSVSQLIRVGRQEVVVVLRVDAEKGYIDLSKSKVPPEEVPKCEEKFNKSKAVHSIMRYLAEVTNNDLEFLYEKIAWPLYKKYGHAFDAFKTAITDPDEAFKDIEFPSPEIRAQLIESIQRRLKPQPVKIRADFEVTCFSYEGIDAIKEALMIGEEMGTDDVPIKITLVAPPLYVMSTTTNERAAGLELMDKAIKTIEDEMKKRGGNVVVKAPPRVVSLKEEQSLNVLMDRLEEQNREVPGDDDTSDNETE
jgi:translation initiation factor 2 subunit 1